MNQGRNVRKFDASDDNSYKPYDSSKSGEMGPMKGNQGISLSSTNTVFQKFVADNGSIRQIEPKMVSNKNSNAKNESCEEKLGGAI